MIDSEATGPRSVAGARLGLAAAAGLPLALLGEPAGVAAIAALDVALVVGAVLESRAMAARVPRVERLRGERLRMGVPHPVVVRLHNAGPHRLRVQVRDDLPAGWSAAPGTLDVALAPWERRDVSYTVTPPRRGRARFGDLHVRLDGPLGLGASITRVAAGVEVRVFPDAVPAASRGLSRRARALLEGGARRVRAAGAGAEFSHLREFVQGDPRRDVDWKASARRTRPVTRVREPERSQQVVLAVDVGRMMAARVADLDASLPRTKLDHAVVAALRLADVALRHGDRVGLVVFDDEIRAFVPPARGLSHARRLLETLADLEAASVHVDLRRLVEFVRVRVPRRSLVVVFSDLLDEAYARPLAEHAAALRTRHLPLAVSIDDPAIDALARRAPDTSDDAFDRAAAADLLDERAGLEALLRSRGVGVVTAPAGALASAAIARYLDVKARQAL